MVLLSISSLGPVYIELSSMRYNFCFLADGSEKSSLQKQSVAQPCHFQIHLNVPACCH